MIMHRAPWIVDHLERLKDAVPTVVIALSSSATTISPNAVLQRLRAWEAHFLAKRPPATIAAVQADWHQYTCWCEAHGRQLLPADVDQLALFVNDALKRGRKRSTLKRYVYTIGLIHEAAGLPNPTRDTRWKSQWLTLEKVLAQHTTMHGTPSNEIKHAGELVATDIAAILATLGTKPRDLRDAAMLLLASDTLVRESELVRVQVEHFHFNPRASRWTLWLPSTGTDSIGAGKDHRYVHEQTMEAISAWQVAAYITTGPLFRPIGGRPQHGTNAASSNEAHVPALALRAREVARIFRRRAMAAGLPHGWSISSHSTRVGTATDLINSGATIPQVQLAGGWRSIEMVRRLIRRSDIDNTSVADLRRQQHASEVP